MYLSVMYMYLHPLQMTEIQFHFFNEPCLKCGQLLIGSYV